MYLIKSSVKPMIGDYEASNWKGFRRTFGFLSLVIIGAPTC
jgi:hypothetical protein